MIRLPDVVAETADTVTFAKSDIANLLEAIEDLEAQAAFVRTRTEESLPADMVQRLCAGENPLRVFREHCGIGLNDLTTMTGLSVERLSELEQGSVAGMPEELIVLAQALHVDADDLVP
jgi:hypothetical protein